MNCFRPYLLVTTVLLTVSCSTKRYSGNELQKHEDRVRITGKHKEIAAPLIPLLKEVMKQVFLIENKVSDLKDKLWETGSNHRVARTNSRIDEIKNELYRLRDIRDDLLGAIQHIDPGFTKPEVIPYKGDNKRYEKIDKPIVLVTLEDKQYFETMISTEERYSESMDFEKRINEILHKYKRACSGKDPTPIGAPGPVRKIPPKKEAENKRYFSGMD